MGGCRKIRLQAGKTAYTDREAARALGLSPNQFRSLLVRRLLHDPALSAIQLTRFHPSDLLALCVMPDHRR